MMCESVAFQCHLNIHLQYLSELWIGMLFIVSLVCKNLEQGFDDMT